MVAKTAAKSFRSFRWPKKPKPEAAEAAGGYSDDEDNLKRTSGKSEKAAEPSSWISRIKTPLLRAREFSLSFFVFDGKFSCDN